MKPYEDIWSLIQLANTTSCLQMDEASKLLEDEAIRLLTIHACTEVLSFDPRSEHDPSLAPPPRIAAAARSTAATQLEAAAATPHFQRIPADGLLALLDHPALGAAAMTPEADSAVQRAVMSWLDAAAAAGGGGGGGGEAGCGLFSPGPRALMARLRLRRWQRLQAGEHGGPPDGPRQVKESPAEDPVRARLPGPGR